LPDALSGLVVFVGETPVVAVDAEELQERQRFTAAHELGHVLLGHHDTFHVDLERSDGIPPEYNWRHERAANEFAASLLMPAPNLRNDVQHLVNVNPVTLAHRYEISVQAMSIRLSTLGLRT
jgi:Zn-dependent peptidase ImmA (M78 family)